MDRDKQIGQKAGWFVVPGHQGRRFCITSSWRPDFLEFFLRERAVELAIGPDAEDPIKLGYLSGIPNLKGLFIYNHFVKRMEDIPPLPGLVEIDLQEYSRQPVDFNLFPELRIAGIEFTKGRSSIFKVQNLDSLSMVHCPYADLRPVTSLENLTSLSLNQGSLVDISDIGSFEKLQKLELTLLRKLENISSLANAQSICSLSLEGCRRITRLDAIGEMSALRVLKIPDCGEIESLKPLLKCKNLEELRFEGGTIISDGDMSVLLNMPNLNRVWMANRRHYTHKREEIPAWSVHQVGSAE